MKPVGQRGPWALLSRFGIKAKRIRLYLCGLTLALVFAPCAHAAGPSDPSTELAPDQPHVDSVSVYSGVEAVNHSWFFYGGALYALNGDLSRRGFLIQGLGGLGQYQYKNSGVPGGIVDGDITEASALLGYQFFLGNAKNDKFETFVGFDWQDNSLHPPDPANPVSGSHTGVVVTAHLESVGPRPFYYDLYGSFASENDTYWSKVRLGHRFGRVVVGPEGAFYGDKNFNSERIGAFIKFPLLKRLDVTAAGGFNFVHNDQFFNDLGSGSFAGLGGVIDSGYGSVSISTWF
jgi:hypothetical protein